LKQGKIALAAAPKDKKKSSKMKLKGMHARQFSRVFGHQWLFLLDRENIHY